MTGLQRFVEAQEPVYSAVLDELRAGRKRTHWMWFIFPQIGGLGTSPMARHFAVADHGEARAYLAHPVLGARLAECVDLTLAWAGKRALPDIFGSIDALKFRSSMTLFEAAQGDPRYGQALDRFCDGQRDAETLRILGE